MEQVLGVLAAGLLIASLTARLVETMRAPSVSGLSAGFVWFGLLLNAGWAAYGLFANVLAQLLPSVYALGVYTYSLVRVHRSGRPQWRSSLIGGTAIAAIVAVAAVNPDLGGFVAGSVGAFSVLPQAWRLWRTRDISGVAPWSWMFMLACTLAWTAYGATAGLTPVWTTNALSGMFTIAVLAGYARARTNRRRPSAR